MKLLIITVLLLIMPGVTLAFYKSLLCFLAVLNIGSPLVIGLILGIFLYYLFFRKSSLIIVFEHEFTHAIVALLLFRKVKKFVVGKNGGYITHVGGNKLGDYFIGLAPYYLPTFTILLLLMRELFLLNYSKYIDGLIGFSLSYHILSNIYELRTNWKKKSQSSIMSHTADETDIGKVGYIFATVFITTIALLVHGILFWKLSGNKGFMDFFQIIIMKTRNIIDYLFISIIKLVK